MINISNEERKLIDETEEKVCRYFNVPCQSIINFDMTAQVSLARGYIFYILHVEYGLSIGKLTTVYLRKKRAVFWNINKIRHLLKQRMYKEIYDNILSDEKK